MLTVALILIHSKFHSNVMKTLFVSSRDLSSVCLFCHDFLRRLLLYLDRGLRGKDDVQSEPAASILYPDYALRAGRSGDRIPVGAGLSAHVQTGPEAQTVSYTRGTGLFPWVKRPKRGVDHQHHLKPRLKKKWSYTSTPTLGLSGLF